MTGELPVRRVTFAYPDDMDPMWVPHNPEFAAACNAVSLGMPYAEPLFIKAVRSTFDRLDDEQRAHAETYVRQEVGHYSQHKKLNAIVAARYPATLRLQRWMARCADWVWRRSPKFRVAYAAGGETISYGVARYAEQHLGDLFDDAEPVPATLFLWHLAEEIEHKSSTYDVFCATDGSKLRYAWAMTMGFVNIVSFTIIGTLMQLWGERRLHLPVCWWRLLRLAVGLAFVLIPVMVVSALPGHHPRQFTDPPYLPAWLRQYDPATGTIPIWGSTDVRSALGGEAPTYSATDAA
ncbi:MAG: metal-dependent hydrolase [Acidimicrobiales bacterium]|nr:metal-dependent hydrolase [Acidimicrobiales bacterium]